MAKHMDDAMFWLPTEFLDDDDDDFKAGKPYSGVLNDDVFSNVSTGFYSPFGPTSDMSSPVESVMGSTETESDEEDYLNGLTRKLAQYTLEDDLTLQNHHSKSPRVMAGSPQSTLCGCKQISSRGSPNSPSPPLPVNRNEAACELLYAAAGEIAKLRMAEEAASRYHNLNRSNIPPQLPRKTATPNLQFHQLQAAQLKFEQLKRQQMMKQQQQYRQMMQQNRANMKPVGQALSAWPTLQQSQQQQPPGSGMRAVFLGNPNTTKRECTGTGVFLPRQSGAPIVTCKKRGYSTVLLPDRVVKALNLNLEDPPRSNGGLVLPDLDAEIRYRNSALMAEQRRQQAEKDLRLPHEWTY